MANIPEWVKKEKQRPAPTSQPQLSEELQRRMDFPIGKEQ